MNSSKEASRGGLPATAVGEHTAGGLNPVKAAVGAPAKRVGAKRRALTGFRPRALFTCALYQPEGRGLDIKSTSDSGAGRLTSSMFSNIVCSMKRHPLDLGARNLATRLAEGAPYERKGIATFEIDVSGKCESPVGFAVAYSTGDRDLGRHDRDRSMFIDGTARCRRCEACRRYRRGLWAGRARNELGAAERTWFGTLTLNPNAQAQLEAATRVAAKRAGYDLDAVEPAERFRLVGRMLGVQLARYLKRLRFESKARLRYLFVVERHKSGWPHLHCLLHESVGAVRKAVLERQWPYGFSSWRLVGHSTDDHAKVAWYVVKYLLKEDNATRIRASLHYGSSAIVGATGGLVEPPVNVQTSLPSAACSPEGDDSKAPHTHGTAESANDGRGIEERPYGLRYGTGSST